MEYEVLLGQGEGETLLRRRRNEERLAERFGLRDQGCRLGAGPGRLGAQEASSSLVPPPDLHVHCERKGRCPFAGGFLLQDLHPVLDPRMVRTQGRDGRRETNRQDPVHVDAGLRHRLGQGPWRNN